MFTTRVLPPSVMTLAVLAAIAAPVRADTSEAIQTHLLAAAVDSERNNSGSILTRIQADSAHARGITGQGITIAVLDTGIGIGHREFSDAGKLALGYNALNGGSDVIDPSGHGTHVAGILGAGRNGKGLFGVAYDATLLPMKVFPDSGSGSTTVLDRALRHAIGKAQIVNMSIGASARYDARATQEAVRAGLLVVASAGNDHAANPGWPARFARESWANNQIIAVGAIDGANRIASFSNRAGDSAAWFLVAPGVGIASSYLNDRYAYMSGTSMAAPMVSGAAALMKQLWPALRADQLATILFVTAIDLGAPGIDAVYGRGLLNIEKALQPIGEVTTTTFNGRNISVLSGSMQPSAATSKLWHLAASGQMRVIGLDDFERDFSIDLGAAVSRPAGLSLEQVFGSMDHRIEVAEQVLADGASLAVAYDHKLAGAGGVPAQTQNSRLAAFSLQSTSAGGTETAIGVGGLAAQYFGAGGLRIGHGAALGQVPALSNPYLTLVPGASHAAIGQRVGDVKLKFGFLTSGFNQMLASQESYASTTTSYGTQPRASSTLFEVSKSYERAALSLALSQTSESNAYLGAYSSGALSLGSTASTSAVHLAGAMLLAPNVTLAGQASYGVTPGGAGRDNLITEVSKARTNAFSLALVASDRIKRGDRFSLSVSQPMRAYSGRIVMDVLSGTNGGSGASRDRLIFSMVPLGREMRAEMQYHLPLGRLEAFAATIMVRRDPNNMIETAMDKLIAVRYVKQF